MHICHVLIYLQIYIYIYILAIKSCFGQGLEAGECNGRARSAEKFCLKKKKCLFLHRGLDGRTKFLTVEKTNHSEFDLYILSGYANMPIHPSNIESELLNYRTFVDINAFQCDMSHLKNSDYHLLI